MIVRAIYAMALVQFLVVSALLLDNMDLLKQVWHGPKPPTQATPSKTQAPSIPPS
jgi:hypothetical protein